MSVSSLSADEYVSCSYCTKSVRWCHFISAKFSDIKGKEGTETHICISCYYKQNNLWCCCICCKIYDKTIHICLERQKLCKLCEFCISSIISKDSQTNCKCITCVSITIENKI